MAGFRRGWLPQGGFPGFRKGIQRAEIVIPQVFDNESLFRALGRRWIPGGFPGESACRKRNAALRPPAYDWGRGGTMPGGEKRHIRDAASRLQCHARTFNLAR